MALIDELAPRFGVEPACRALGAPVSSYYQRKQRGTIVTAREERDRLLVEQIGLKSTLLSYRGQRFELRH